MGMVVHVLNFGLVASQAVRTLVMWRTCRGVQCIMNFTVAREHPGVARANSTAGAPGSVSPESQMMGDADQEQLPVFNDSDSDSEVDLSVAAEVEESDEDQEVAVGSPVEWCCAFRN